MMNEESKFVKTIQLYAGVLNTKKSFVICAFVVLVTMLMLNTQTRPTYDEAIDRAYGKAALNYYSTFGKDTTCLDPRSEGWNTHFPEMRYYGTGYEIIPAIITKYVSQENEFVLRHVLGTLYGFGAIFFAALIAIEIESYLLGIIVFAFLLFSPTFIGFCSLETKTIPMTMGYTMGFYYLLKLVAKAPSIKWQYLVGAFLGISLAVSLRVAALIIALFYAFYLLFICLKYYKKYALKQHLYFLVITGSTVVFSVIIGLLFYPNFWEQKLGHVIDCIQLVKKVHPVYLLFEGKTLTNQTAPWYYILKIFAITTPLFLLIGFVIAPFLLSIRKKFKLNEIILYSGVVIPVFLLIVQKATLYNGWRHIAFIYPLFCVMAAMGWFQLYAWLRMYLLKYALLLSLGITMLFIGIWMFKNSAYTYSYFNVCAGNYKKNVSGKYELEFYTTGTLVAYDKLWEAELKKSEEKIVVYCNNPILVEYAKDTKKIKPNITIQYGAFNALSQANWEYAIISPRLISKEIIDLYYPPKESIAEEKIEGVVVAAVLKRKNKNDYNGNKLLNSGDYKQALQLLSESYKDNPTNYQIWLPLGQAYFYNNDYQNAIAFTQAALNLRTDLGGLFILGASSYYLNHFDDAFNNLNTCLQYEKNPDQLLSIHYLLGMCLLKTSRTNDAVKEFDLCLQLNQKFLPAIQALINYYGSIGNVEKMEEYKRLL